MPVHTQHMHIHCAQRDGLWVYIYIHKMFGKPVVFWFARASFTQLEPGEPVPF